MKEDFRDRWKAVNRATEKKSEDLFSFWNDQKKMQEEDKKLEEELEEAKKRARELKKTLYKHKFGEQKSRSKDVIKKATEESKKHFKNISNKALILHKNNKKLTTVGAPLVIIVVVGLILFSNTSDKKDTLGESTSKIPIAENLPREKPSDFKLVYPNGDESSYDVVRISPDGAEPSYTYLDRFTEDGQIFRVTQQAIPQNFDLAKIATDFQATNVIQVDENIIYHGYSEKGGIQSLIFEKNNKLISIRSSEKFSDDQWASYYLSLK